METMDAAERKTLRKTLKMEQVMRQAAQDPLKTFEEWPLLDVRRKCLEAMNNERNYCCYNVSPGVADWAEKAIEDLAVNNDAIADELVQWYLFRPENEEIIVRALKFVIGLKAKNQVWYSHERTSKLILGRVKKDAEKFGCKYLDDMPDFLKCYVKEIFRNFKENGLRRTEYLDDEWFCFERALKILVVAKDFSFLPEIEEIILLYQEKKINTTEYAPFYVRDQNLAMLKSVKKYLYAAKKDSIKNGE